MRAQEIDNVLKDLYISNINLHQKDTELTEKMVYHYLTKLGLPQSERNKRINDLFPDWVETFINFPNIDVFNSPDWKYFCQFTNGEVEPDCIKMYISLDSSHIRQGAKIIFDFLAANNIKHRSKIGSDVRTDDIVIRLSSPDDAKKLSHYISNSNYIKSGMLKVNPFCFENNGIGYAFDGLLSYNSCVAQVITDYINRMYELGIDLNNININSFYQFTEAYLQVPETVNNLPHVEGNTEKQLDASLVLELIKYSLGSNNIEDFFKFYNYAINKKNEFHNNASYQVDKEELFKEVVLTTMMKYPKGFDQNNLEYSGFNFIDNYLNGNIKGITRDNNLRERVKSCLTPNDVFSLAIESGMTGKSNYDIVMNYVKTIILNEIIKCSETRFPNHGLDQVQAYLRNGRQTCITESVGKARTLAKNLNPNMIYELFTQLGVQDIYQYAQHYYKDKNKNIQK